MAAEFNIPAEAHRLELTGREHLTVSGVEDVERFDETGVVMSTAAGMLVVTGEDLHIGKLSFRTVADTADKPLSDYTEAELVALWEQAKK